MISPHESLDSNKNTINNIQQCRTCAVPRARSRSSEAAAAAAAKEAANALAQKRAAEPDSSACGNDEWV